MKRVGNRVKELRRKFGFSQLDLETECGFAPGMVSRIENNKVNPTKETLFVISKAMRLNENEVIWIFGITEFIEKTAPSVSPQ